MIPKQVEILGSGLVDFSYLKTYVQWSRQETTSLGVTKGPQSTAKDVEIHTKAKRQSALAEFATFLE